MRQMPLDTHPDHLAPVEVVIDRALTDAKDLINKDLGPIHLRLTHLIRSLIPPHNGPDIEISNRVHRELLADGFADLNSNLLVVENPRSYGYDRTYPGGHDRFIIVDATGQSPAYKPPYGYRSGKVIKIVDSQPSGIEARLLDRLARADVADLNQRPLSSEEAQLIVSNTPVSGTAPSEPTNQLAKTLCNMRLHGFKLSEEQQELVTNWQSRQKHETVRVDDPTNVLLAKVLLTLAQDTRAIDPATTNYFHRLVLAHTVGQFTDSGNICVVNHKLAQAPIIREVRARLSSRGNLAA